MYLTVSQESGTNTELIRKKDIEGGVKTPRLCFEQVL